MEKIKNTHKSYKLNHTKVISAGTIGIALFFTTAFLMDAYVQAGYFNFSKETPIEKEEDSEIFLLDEIMNQLLSKEEGITIQQLKENILNIIALHEENNTLSKNMEYNLMIIKMRLDKGVTDELSLEEAISNIYSALMDGYALKGQVPGRTPEDVLEDWGLTLTLEN